jgi:hypothetical protein
MIISVNEDWPVMLGFVLPNYKTGAKNLWLNSTIIPGKSPGQSHQNY